MTYAETARIESEVFETTYIIGRLGDGRYTYIWSDRDLEAGIVPADALADPENMHGAIIGTADEMRADFETCVGCWRDVDLYCDPERAEAAEEVVEVLEGGLN